MFCTVKINATNLKDDGSTTIIARFFIVSIFLSIYIKVLQMHNVRDQLFLLFLPTIHQERVPDQICDPKKKKDRK